MKTLFKVAVLGTCSFLMLLVDAPSQAPYVGLQLVPEAHAILGVRRRTAAVTAVAVESADSAKMAQANQQAAASQQQAAAAQQQAAAAQKQAAAAAAPPPAAAAGAPLPVGTVVPALPAGCTSTPVGGVEYYYCGGNFYRAVFQGTQLVYVTAKP
jgi:biotin carboxyl carrier protein